jgi:hypothetical protein
MPSWERVLKVLKALKGGKQEGKENEFPPLKGVALFSPNFQGLQDFQGECQRSPPPASDCCPQPLVAPATRWRTLLWATVCQWRPHAPFSPRPHPGAARDGGATRGRGRGACTAGLRADECCSGHTCAGGFSARRVPQDPTPAVGSTALQGPLEEVRICSPNE